MSLVSLILFPVGHCMVLGMMSLSRVFLTNISYACHGSDSLCAPCITQKFPQNNKWNHCWLKRGVYKWIPNILQYQLCAYLYTKETWGYFLMNWQEGNYCFVHTAFRNLLCDDIRWLLSQSKMVSKIIRLNTIFVN